MNTRRTILGFGLTLPLLPSVAQAKIEDIYKGRIIITKDRLPMRFSSESGFIAAVTQQPTDRVWPKEEKGNDHAVWVVEYIAFFAKPLNDNELSLKFWE